MYNKDSMCISFSATRKKNDEKWQTEIKQNWENPKVQNLVDLLQLISWWLHALIIIAN